MNKNITISIVIILSISISTILLLNMNGTEEILEEQLDQNMIEYIDTLPMAELTENQTNGLIYMREEEKLARDVYIGLFEIWGVKVFENIVKSEITHMGAVKILLDRYGIADTIEYTDYGTFSIDVIQNLYNDLMEKGSQSVVEALNVGALIEEVDIIDLWHFMNNTTAVDFLYVYDILLTGSYKHLIAFTNQLTNNGVIYSPVLLTQEEYDDIVA